MKLWAFALLVFPVSFALFADPNPVTYKTLYNCYNPTLPATAPSVAIVEIPATHEQYLAITVSGVTSYVALTPDSFKMDDGSILNGKDVGSSKLSESNTLPNSRSSA